VVFPTGFTFFNSQRALGSVTGRLGYTWGPALLYVKGGYAYSANSQSMTFAGAPVSFGLDGNNRDGYIHTFELARESQAGSLAAHPARYQA
jgi:outer membrane immunogenic protein